MHDRTLLIDRIGFEVQYRLVVDPRVVSYDPRARKLGTKLHAERLRLDTPPPPGWTWACDPDRGSLYLPDDAELPSRARKWVVTDHRTRFADAVGLRTYRVWDEQPRVVHQLELVSRPFDRRYDAQAWRADSERIHASLQELLDRGVVAAFPGTEDKQQGIAEQVSLQITGPGDRIDPIRKLMCLALGVYAMCRWGPRGTLTHQLNAQIAHNLANPARLDLFSNVRALLDAFLDGHPRLTLPWLQKWLLTRPHGALLVQNLDNNLCSWLVHGLVVLSLDELKTVSVRDFELLRELGRTSLFLDVFAGEDFAGPLAETARVDFLRGGLRQFSDLETTQRAVRAAVLGERTSPVERVAIPLFHLRKSQNPGHVYIECRSLEPIKRIGGQSRYRHLYRAFPIGRKKTVRVVEPAHLHLLGTDVRRLFEICMTAGRLLRDRVQQGRLELEELQADFPPLLQWLEDHYEPAIWSDPDV